MALALALALGLQCLNPQEAGEKGPHQVGERGPHQAVSPSIQTSQSSQPRVRKRSLREVPCRAQKEWESE